jgi:hypothetical protein
MNEATQRATESLQSIPRNAECPVFREPWEAQAFALALSLSERGVFSWKEWAAARTPHGMAIELGTGDFIE